MKEQIYLSDGQLAKRYGISRSTVWRWLKKIPHFPKPRKISPGCTRWVLTDVEAWEATWH